MSYPSLSFPFSNIPSTSYHLSAVILLLSYLAIKPVNPASAAQQLIAYLPIAKYPSGKYDAFFDAKPLTLIV